MLKVAFKIILTSYQDVKTTKKHHQWRLNLYNNIQHTFRLESLNYQLENHSHSLHVRFVKDFILKYKELILQNNNVKFISPFKTEAVIICKSMDWFLYDNGLRLERVNKLFSQFKGTAIDTTFTYWGECLSRGYYNAYSFKYGELSVECI